MNDLNLTFAALSDPTRRAILARLVKGSASVGELAHPFDISLPAISRHLRVMEEASLIERKRYGKHRQCTLRPKGLEEAHQWLEIYLHFWEDAFDRLDALLKQQPKTRRKQ